MNAPNDGPAAADTPPNEASTPNAIALGPAERPATRARSMPG